MVTEGPTNHNGAPWGDNINTYQLVHLPISWSAKVSIYEYNSNNIEFNINNIENNINIMISMSTI